ncbi:Ger(x)C family spore germination protein [Paenibacillus sp. VCA1]|uniref:Ger(x)C family spore germination protein n=1 Tax=Paenibacillus sp. VCA1 TaxID=3039148 RepID=UPI0028725BF4|nr:Ger(x)C family spore germination protein [Paenibacillus sp. VCA1]MDR9852320.1 Ger(x)C family spore germination protein [Paenibacillus sp. VCA1]
MNMMMKWIRCILALALLTMPLTGCWGAREIEHMIYVNTVGVDYVKGQVVLYIQMLNFSGIAKRESGQSQPQKTFVGKAEGDSFDTAVFNLYTSSPQRVVWSNVKTIVFSEAALKNGIVDQVLDVWDRYYEFRYTVWTMATKEPIEDLLNTPSIADLSVVYSQLNSPMRIYEQNSVISPLYLYKFIWKWKEKGETVLLPNAEIIPDWTDNRKPSPNVSMTGVCFLQKQKFRGCLEDSDILGLRWLEKNTRRTSLVIRKGNEVQAMMVMNKVKSSIRPKLRQGKPVFDIKVSTQATLPQLNKNVTKKKLEMAATKEIKDQIMKTYLKGLEMDVDAYGLSGILRRSMPDAWHRLSAEDKIPLDPGSIENIDIKVNLISGGISKLK